MASGENEELVRRIKLLEEENARLKQSTPHPAAVTCREGEYKGNPVLTFEGPFKPFSLGLKKLRVVKECGKQVQSFLDKHEHDPAVKSLPQSSTRVDFDDGKI